MGTMRKGGHLFTTTKSPKKKRLKGPRLIHRNKRTLATMGMSKAGRANWLAASHPERLSPRLSALSNEADEAELAYLLTRVSMVEGAERMVEWFESDDGRTNK